MKQKIPIQQQQKTRLFFIDFLKAISITAVVSYHSLFLPKSTYVDSAFLLDVLFSPLRFCVPVLLTISFLLLEQGLSIDSPISTISLIKKRYSRLAIPTLFWFSLVAALKLFTGNSISEIAIQIIQGEIFTGAYYLLILFQLIPLYILLRDWLQNPRNLFLVILIQLGIFFVIYQSVLKGNNLLITGLLSLERSPFIYWFIYAAIGGFLSKNLSGIVKISSFLPPAIKLAIILGNFLMLLVEYNLLFPNHPGYKALEYVMISCIFSPISFCLCFADLRENQLPVWLLKLVKILAKYSLGIFCINGILYLFFLFITTNIFNHTVFMFHHILFIKIASWIILIAISLALSILLNKIGLKKVVT
ncbi:MAG: acyltransferase [Nostocaceae cyanobacterium]|nr:acyltransferase [Nostocaceae cyanobacterium]